MSGLLVLILFAFILNEVRAGYVQTKARDLLLQADVFANLIEEQAINSYPEPTLREPAAGGIVIWLNLPAPLRLIVSDPQGGRVADSFLLSSRVDPTTLPPVQTNTKFDVWRRNTIDNLSKSLHFIQPRNFDSFVVSRSFEDELKDAFTGQSQASQRLSDRGQRIVSVTVPIRHVSRIVGYVTLESSDIEAVVKTERLALLPFALLAMGLAILTGWGLAAHIGRPLDQLSQSTLAIKRGESDSLDLPKLLARKDEIGVLASSIDTMTLSLMERIRANAAFAADVSHELKNPLTAIRSAIETAELVKDSPEKLDKLLALVMHDVHRLDRLITDISNASRVEAELTQMPQQKVELVDFGTKLVAHYADNIDDNKTNNKPKVVFENNTGMKNIWVRARTSGLDQILTNLIDNARSFSPPKTDVYVRLDLAEFGDTPRISITVEDQGPGIPADKLEQIFERFYTDRPEGSHGDNSGLGLSIVRQIVEFHRGTIRAENRPTRGARFIVELDYVP